MKTIRLSEPWSGKHPGAVVVVDDVNAGELMIRQMDCELVSLTVPQPNTQGGKTLVVRAGGIGDIIQAGPLVKQLARTDRVTLSCAPPFLEVAGSLPGVANTLAYPPALSILEKFDRVIYLENVVERERQEHVADAFLRAGGFDPDGIATADKAPQIKVPRTPYKFAKKGKRVGFQIAASAKCRTVSPEHMSRIISHFAGQRWEIMLFGAPGSIANSEKGVINLTQLKRPPSIMQSAAIMQSCDVVVCPDSGLLHMAAAAGVPSVGLFGAIPAHLRTAYSPFQVGIDGQAPCAPCFWHARNGHFPPDCPSRAKGVCAVLEIIKPELVYDCALRAIELKHKGKK